MTRVLRHLRWPAFLILWGCMGVAIAEPLYKLPSLREDRGIMVGAFHLWPEVFVETRYDSNLFRRSDKEIAYNLGNSPAGTYDGAKPSAVIFRAMPSFEAFNPTGRLVRFHFAGMGDFRAYYANERSAIVRAQEKIGGNARTRVHFFPLSVFQVYVEDRFDRSLQARNEVSRETFTRMYNEAGAGLIAKPGEALSFDAHYSFVRDVFVEFDTADKMVNTVGLTGRWRFFPRTEAFVNGSVAFTTYDHARSVGATQVGNFKSSPLRVEGGLNGYITRRLFVLLSGGYGASFHEQGAKYNGFLATAMLGYEIPDTLVVQGGYSRRFEDSLFANYFTSDAIELDGQLRLWNRVDFDVVAKYQFVNYGEAIAIPSVVYKQQQRSDGVLTVKGIVSLNFLRYFGVNLGVQFTDVITEFYSENVTSKFRDYGAFSKLEVFGNVVGRY